MVPEVVLQPPPLCCSIRIFQNAGLEELFWNIVTWYHFFRHFEEFTCKIQWYVSKDMAAYIFIRNLADWSTKIHLFQ